MLKQQVLGMSNTKAENISQENTFLLYNYHCHHIYSFEGKKYPKKADILIFQLWKLDVLKNTY